jgi:sec-independent protein translocase protein TatC
MYLALIPVLNTVGPTELIIVLAIVLLLFGAKRIPELARGLGTGIREFKRGARDEGEEKKERLNNLSPAQGLITDMKLVLYAAFVLTIPVLLYQAWMFVAPAVGETGRAFTYVLVGLASSLFLGGVAFGYYVVLPVGLEFLLNYANDRYNEMITADTYLPFVTRFLLAFGIVFELPAATYVGAKLGLVTASFLKRYRRHAIVVNAVLAAALTPGQDPFSMILMAIPMVLMYEISILIARFVNPGLTEEPLSEGEQDL